METLLESDIVSLGLFLLAMVGVFGALLLIRKRRTTHMLIGALLMAAGGIEILGALALTPIAGPGFWLLLVIALLIELFGIILTGMMLRQRRLEKKG